MVGFKNSCVIEPKNMFIVTNQNILQFIVLSL